MSAALDSRVLALTLWGEAAGRPVRALEGVAAVAVNRARAAGQGVAAACRAPFAFPCWTPHAPRLAAMRAVPPGDAEMAVCACIAARALAGTLPDPTGGALRYHEADHLPRWALGRVPAAEIGGLVFYRAGDALDRR